MTDIIAFTGKRGSGKDTAAEVLTDIGYVNVKFAGALKAMLKTLLEYAGADEDMADRMIEGDLKETPTDFLGGNTPRHAMQSLGVAFGRECMGDNFWVDILDKKIQALDKVVVTDVRFENELELIRKHGGLSLRIERKTADEVVDGHSSETGVDSLDVDMAVSNNRNIPYLTSRIKNITEDYDFSEVWKTVNDFEGLYQVSSKGNIRNVSSRMGVEIGRHLVNSVGTHGYLKASLTKNGKTKYTSIHRVVAETFIPNPENKKQVNHKNGIKHDNNLDNLEWCTPSENAYHAGHAST